MSDLKTYSQEEISQHHTKSDLWLVIHGKVYDVSRYIEDHPGGVDALVEVAGTDATTSYEDVGHSEDSREIMEQFLVGYLAGAIVEASKPPPPPESDTATRPNQLNHAQGPPISTNRQPPMWEKYRTMALYIASLGSIALVDYEAYIHSPKPSWPQFEHSGFWRGVFISSAVGISIATAVSIYVEKTLHATKDFNSYPAHMKPAYEVARTVTDKHGVLNPREYKAFPLIRKDQLSPDSFRFVFALPKQKSVLGLPIGQHVAIRANVDGKSVSRSYTPVSNNSDLGRLELCIKVYPDGALTGHYMTNLKIGDSVEFRGPTGMMRYRKGMCSQIGMVAGGTGITPMYQVIRAICEDPSDKTTISLLYGNNTLNDILLRDKLDGFAKTYPEKFRVWYVLGKPPKDWQYGNGYVTKDLAQTRLPAPAPDSKIMLCGPPGLVNAMKKSLVELGFDKPNAVSKMNDQVFAF
ncbi:hypothetical protein MMC18_001158 [Xylographa bjoerkii]|nr:hypothetical protein [Xylographa bjoerkii]